MHQHEVRATFAAAFERATSFREHIADAHASPRQGYAANRARFEAKLPEGPSAGPDVIARLADLAEEGLMTATGPRFFGWVIGGSHPTGVAADWLTSAWGQNAGNHHASPAAAAAETVAMGWLLELLDLPRESSVGFVSGATIASFTCLAAARSAVLHTAGWDVERDGLSGAPPVSVLIGAEAHSTVFAALQLLGFGHDRAIRVATDAQGAMQPDALAAALDAVAGPTIVILQAGQINTGAFDDFAALVPLARAHDAWVHVDGAFGLWARVSDELRGLTNGIELADSWATDGHKWLQTPYDCGFAIVRDEAAHRRAMTIAASYLPVAAEGERDPAAFVPELSRRARGFATWAVISALGRSGIREIVERDCAVARLMADRLAATPGIGVENDVVLNQVIVRFACDRSDAEADRITRATIEQLQRDGVCFAGGAEWQGRQVMRLSVSGCATTAEDGRRSADAILAAFATVSGA